MSHREKVEAWIAYSKNTKSIGRMGWTPIDKLFRALGLKLAPIYLWGYMSKALFWTLLSGAYWSLSLFLYFYESDRILSNQIFMWGFLYGHFIGPSLAWLQLRTLNELGLSDWESFDPDDFENDSGADDSTPLAS